MPVCGTEKSVPFLQLGYQGGPHLNESEDVSPNPLLFNKQSMLLEHLWRILNPIVAASAKVGFHPLQILRELNVAVAEGEGKLSKQPEATLSIFMRSGCGWGGAS